MTAVFSVENMHCKGCARHVVEAVQAAQPGAEVKVDLATKQVEVTPAPKEPQKLAAAIAAAGYPANIITPSPAPECEAGDDR